MKQFTKIASAAFAALLFSSCASNYISPNYSTPGFSIEELKGAKTLLVVSDSADVREFKSSFRRAFGDHREDLSKYLSQKILDSLSQPESGFSLVSASPKISRILDLDSAARDSLLQTDSLFKSAGAKFIVNVRSITIDNSTTFIPATMTPSGPGGAMTMGGGGTSENCVVSFEVEIWDAAALTKKASFKTTGSSSVFLFFYKTALENAVDNAALHFAGYARSGRTKF